MVCIHHCPAYSLTGGCLLSVLNCLEELFLFPPFAFQHVKLVKLAQDFRGKEDSPYPRHSLFPTQPGHPPAQSICQAKLYITAMNSKGKDFA